MNNHGTHKTYIAGFVLSILLTLGAYWIVEQHVITDHSWLSHPVIILAIVGLAIAQLVVQLFLFLHLGQEQKPRWNLLASLFTVLVVVIVAFGSLWIMKNLDYHMTPHDVDQYMLHEEGIQK